MDMESLMAQAQSLQTKIAAAQDSLAQKQVRGIGGNGNVIITMTGKYDVIDVNINDAALAGGAQNLSVFVMDAYKDAKEKADALIEKTMSEVTGSLSE